MKNEEKAAIIGKMALGFRDEKTQEIFNACMEMAAWKDEQIEQLKCCYNCANWRDGLCDHVGGDVMADFVCSNWTMKEKGLPEKPQFKPFDKVVVKLKNSALVWYADFYSHEDEVYFHFVGDFTVNKEEGMILPFNEKTAKLVGTTDEWEGGEE